MEYVIIENAQLQAAANEAADAQVRELNDLQLAFVGGGSGDVVWA
jgi:hypothetical protein